MNPLEYENNPAPVITGVKKGYGLPDELSSLDDFDEQPLNFIPSQVSRYNKSARNTAAYSNPAYGNPAYGNPALANILYGNRAQMEGFCDMGSGNTLFDFFIVILIIILIVALVFYFFNLK